MRLTKEDFKIIRRLESEYGSLVNVSEYNKYLQAIRKKALTGVKEPVPLLSSRYRKTSRYNLKLVSKIADLRKKGYTLKEISVKTKVNYNVIAALTNVYNICTEKEIVCRLVEEGIVITAASFNGLAKDINKRGYEVTGKELELKYRNKLPKKMKKKYINFVIGKERKYTAPSKEKMKEICYKTKRASCPSAYPEDIVDALNKINGKKMFNIEETFMYDN